MYQNKKIYYLKIFQKKVNCIFLNVTQIIRFAIWKLPKKSSSFKTCQKFENIGEFIKSPFIDPIFKIKKCTCNIEI
jgi:hypothetical protein